MTLFITIEPVQPELYPSVGQLMAYGFGYKFENLTSLSIEELGFTFTKLLHYLPQEPNNLRIVARQQGVVVGTMCIKWKLIKFNESNGSHGFDERNKSIDFSWWNKCNSIGNWKLFKLITGLYLLQHSPKLEECYIEDLVVHPQHQGKGIGKQLLQWAHQFMRQSAGMTYLSLHVASHNHKAIQLYERYQFSQQNCDNSLLTALLLGEKRWNYMTRKGELYA
ncbi:ribosomal protein S18 acetylase RimI-like enzyme [Paenibacillus turicensis]|uniref:Ribosomal protein S18 acetylase RimI-like enzyme n=1 Tax=Paenibacillus turicensis TaxID=160487 RepID=A0ABS4FWT7_9BACL|nr:ribosomal protein S18 acetylase RimI-like enzyme [Paenibacillus turicensis]